MSYTYLLEGEEEYLAECFSNIPVSVLSRLNLIADKSYSNDNETESCRGSQSGMMCKPSTENLGGAVSELLPVDFLARIFHKPTGQRENVSVSTVRSQDYGDKWQGSLARYDRVTSLWKTRQCLLFEDSEQSLATWPEWGTTRDGECFMLPSVVSVIDVNDCSYLPTPTASDAFRLRYSAQTFQNIYEKRKKTKVQGDGTLGTVLPTFHQKRPSPESVEMMMSWPNGWTGLQPVETGKFQQWLVSHGKL